MNLSHLFMVSLALPLSAFAENKAIDGTSASLDGTTSSIYQKLEGLFVTGTMPMFAHTGIAGFSGRCFTASQEGAVKGAAYLVKADSDRNGPLGGGLDIQSLWSDRLEQYDAAEAGTLSRAGGTWFPANPFNNSIAATLSRTTGSFLRVNGSYYIEKIADPDGRNTGYYCYYYGTLAP